MILFVCTGNTCRSPMAQIICRSLLEESAADRVAEFEVCSAGLTAVCGAEMSVKAVQALRQIGYEAVPLKSRPLTRELLGRARMIYAMQEMHLFSIRKAYMDMASKTDLLDEEGDVPDPIGLDLRGYVECAKKIEAALKKKIPVILQSE